MDEMLNGKLPFLCSVAGHGHEKFNKRKRGLS